MNPPQQNLDDDNAHSFYELLQGAYEFLRGWANEDPDLTEQPDFSHDGSSNSVRGRLWQLFNILHGSPYPNFTHGLRPELSDALNNPQLELSQLLSTLLPTAHPDPNLTQHADSPTNAHILGYVEGQYLQTLHELDIQSWWLRVDSKRGYLFDSFLAWVQNYGFLTEVRHGASFHTDLPPFSSAPHNVWLLLNRRATPIEALRHWSIYTQGHLFHLAADKRESDNTTSRTRFFEGPTRQTNLFQRVLRPNRHVGAPISQKHLDILNDYRPYNPNGKNSETKYIAYNVGRTAYTWQQVSDLGDAVIGQMRTLGSYNVWENNCQHYVLSLMRRIVMTERDHIAVCGTLPELVEYDLDIGTIVTRRWLSLTRAHLFILPTSVSSRYGSWTWARPYANHPWPQWVQVLLSGWEEILVALMNASNPLEELENQCRLRFNDYSGWAQYDQDTFRIWRTVFQYAIAGASTLRPVVAETTGVEIEPWGIFLRVACVFALHLALSRMFYARGSLSQIHYDLERIHDGV